MQIEEKIKKLGLEIPAPPNYKGNYIGAKISSEKIVFVCGQGPFATTKNGMVGNEVTIEEAYIAARETCLNSLSQLKRQIGDLDRVKQVLQVIGVINSAEGFFDQPKVLNGFTDLLVELWGDPAGKPARAALPIHFPGWIIVEAWMTVELKS